MLPLDRYESAIGEARTQRLREMATLARRTLAKRVIWNVNSTATGGGVAEILHALLPYARGAGIDARWVVVEGDSEFFAITKRIHNRLHGVTVPGEKLGEKEHAHYAAVLEENASRFRELVQPRDIVILHDPQTAGLVGPLRRAGATVIWRCHIGHEAHRGVVARTWEFLRRYVEDAHAFIFSRKAYAPPWIDARQLHIMAPSIDPFSAKNHPMSRATVHAIIRQAGLLNTSASNGIPSFSRWDGTQGTVVRRAEIVSEGQRPVLDTPLVVQVSRWDRLKDMMGVMRGFAQHIDGIPDVHLALVGPDVRGVQDDPEGEEVLDECLAVWRKLPESKRRRIHLVSLPMEDIEENAAIVNAIQRHAAIVVQKSLHEGFGLTVTEAMWKGRPILASRVGGIQDQIVDGTHGLLVADPNDLKSFGHALRRLLKDRPLAKRLGRNAQRRALSRYLGARQLIQYVELFAKIAP
jgi:trehalose synthase